MLVLQNFNTFSLITNCSHGNKVYKLITSLWNCLNLTSYENILNIWLCTSIFLSFSTLRRWCLTTTRNVRCLQMAQHILCAVTARCVGHHICVSWSCLLPQQMTSSSVVVLALQLKTAAFCVECICALQTDTRAKYTIEREEVNTQISYCIALFFLIVKCTLYSLYTLYYLIRRLDHGQLNVTGKFIFKIR